MTFLSTLHLANSNSSFRSQHDCHPLHGTSYGPRLNGAHTASLCQDSHLAVVYGLYLELK
jgi:hypothetical protein